MLFLNDYKQPYCKNFKPNLKKKVYLTRTCLILFLSTFTKDIKIFYDNITCYLLKIKCIQFKTDVLNLPFYES